MVKARIALTLTCLAVGTATAAAVALAGRQAADRPSANPEAFLRHVVAALARNDYAGAWQTLHPAQQLAARLEEYVSCESASPIPGRLASIRALRTFDERMVVPGTSSAVRTVAVTFRLEIAPPSGQPVRVTLTAHAVPVAGRWRWTLPEGRYEMYRVDGCGYSPPA